MLNRVSGPASAQCDRLLDAMVTVAARYGYGGASVARLVREAGVSRATFYECFADRQTCFLAAYRRLAADLRAGFEQTDSRLIGDALGIALAAGERDPAAARVLLIESLAAPPAVGDEHESLLAELMARAGDFFAVPPPPLFTRALLGGIGGVVAVRAFRGEAGRLSQLREDLVTWVDSYGLGTRGEAVVPAWQQEAGDVGTEVKLPPALGSALDGPQLPRGRGALAPSAVAEQWRLRVLAAVARLCREKGYAAMSVADLVATAGVSREVFYDQFRSKEDAFLATQAYGLEQSVSVTAGRFFSAESWPERVWGGCEGTLSYIASQPDLVYVDLIESYPAGPAAIRRSIENRMAFTLFLEQGFQQRPEAATMPRICAEAIAGAIQELFRTMVREGRSEQMRMLLPQVVYLCLAPFLGVAAASEFVEAKLAAARGA
jgi:AcrR family transcriptional regulator